MKIGIVLAGAAMAGGLFAQEPPAPPAPPNPPDESRQAQQEKRRELQQRRMEETQKKAEGAQRRMEEAQKRAEDAQRRVRVMVRDGRSYLGVGVADIDSERAKALKLADVHGAEVKNVADGSPAEKAGLKEGDVILQYNGQRVEGTDQLQRMARETPPGREVKLQIWRNGAAQTVTMTMGSRRGSGFAFADGREFNFEMPEIRIPPMPPMPDMPSGMMSWRSPVLGVESESLTSQLAQYFGVKEGVLVRSVIKGSAAEKAGIKAGDVILKVDTTTVTSPREISSVLRSVRGSKRTVPVLINRDRKEMTVNVTLEDESSAPRRNSIRAVTVSTSC